MKTRSKVSLRTAGIDTSLFCNNKWEVFSISILNSARIFFLSRAVHILYTEITGELSPGRRRIIWISATAQYIAIVLLVWSSAVEYYPSAVEHLNLSLRPNPFRVIAYRIECTPEHDLSHTARYALLSWHLAVAASQYQRGAEVTWPASARRQDTSTTAN